MIFNKIHHVNNNNNGRFFEVAESIEDYKDKVQEQLVLDNLYEYSNQFNGIIKTVNKAWEDYQENAYCGEIYEFYKMYEHNVFFRRWLVAIICIIIYGFNDDNILITESICCDDNPFLKDLKEILESKNIDDNSIGLNNQDNTFNIYKINNSIIGSCSKKYLVIPACSICGNEEWKKIYNKLTNSYSFYSIKEFLQNFIKINDKIKLVLSLASVPMDSPLILIKDIVNMFVKFNFKIKTTKDIPCHIIENFKFYHISSNSIPEKFLTEYIYITYADEDSNYNSLYPLNPDLAKDIENKKCSIQRIKIDVNDNIETHEIINIKATIYVDYDFIFYDSSGIEHNIIITFYERHNYIDNMVYNTELCTVCMYPDISLDKEYRCKKYTYISNTRSTTEGGNNPLLVCYDSETWEKIRYWDDEFAVMISEQQIHLLEIRYRNDIAGYVLNLRIKDKIYEPLLRNDLTIENINLKPQNIQSSNKMFAYMDFGSSSSSIGYKIENGAINYSNISGSTSIVRNILSQYDYKKYEYYISDYSTMIGTVPSVNVTSVDVLIQSQNEISCLWPYNFGIIPDTYILSKYERKRFAIKPSYKSELSKYNTTETTKSILRNLIYAILCHAIDEKIETVYIIPSLPNETYSVVYNNLLNSIINEFIEYFNINVVNLLNIKNKHLLYESIAISNGTELYMNHNVLTINVDIGDSTTDLSAMYYNNQKKICGCSSVNYAGKELIKESFKLLMRSIAQNCRQNEYYETIRRKLYNNLFTFNDDKREVIDAAIDVVSKKFYPNCTRRGFPRDSTWHSFFLEILENVDLNTDVLDDELQMFWIDLILRYSVLMPVIKSFINVALKMCSFDPTTSININFYGGASKGLLLLDRIKFNGDNFMTRLNNYFNSMSTCQCVVNIPNFDAKKGLIYGLSELELVFENDNSYNLRMKNNEEYVINWNEIDPCNITTFNTNRMRDLSFLERANSAAEFVRVLEKNKNELIKPCNYYDDNLISMFNEYSNLIRNFFISEDVYKKFLVNSFFNQINNTTIELIEENINGNNNTSFKNSINSSIYPEMVKNTSFMYLMSSLLSKNYNFNSEEFGYLN